MLQSYNFICSIHWKQYLKFTFSKLQFHIFNSLNTIFIYIYVAELQFHMFNSLKTIFIYSKVYIYVAELQFHTIFIYSKGYIYVAELQFHMFNSLNTIFIYWTQYLFTVKVIYLFHMFNSLQSYNTISYVQFIEHNIYLQ